MSQTMTKRERMAAVIEARLTAAWLQRCDDSGVPGDWWASEMLELLDDYNELALYPMWAKVNDKGNRMWSASFKATADEEWWEWRINGLDEDSGLTRAASNAIDDLGACYGERDISFLSQGSHQERPTVPDAVVDAWVIVSDDASYEQVTS